jgi:hypothetical protein
MVRDVEELIAAIRLQLDALEVSARRAERIVSQQFGEIRARGEEATDAFRRCNVHADEAARTLSWHTIMVKRMLIQLSKKDGR